MKHNTTNTTKQTSTKTDAKAQAETPAGTAAANAARVIASRTTRSGLDRDIVLHSLLIVSVLVNLFFLAGYLVVSSDSSSAHALAQYIYNI